MWLWYDWVVVVVRQWTQYVVVLWLGCRCCLQSVNTIGGRIMIGLSLSSVSEHNMWSYYDWVVVVVVVSKHNMWSYYDWVVVVVVSKHNMWSYYVWVVVVRQWTQYVVVLWLGCRCCLPSVNTIYGGIMIGLSLSSVSKHNMWWYYDWVVVVFRQ
jgi:hypothetical protein